MIVASFLITTTMPSEGICRPPSALCCRLHCRSACPVMASEGRLPYENRFQVTTLKTKQPISKKATRVARSGLKFRAPDPDVPGQLKPPPSRLARVLQISYQSLKSMQRRGTVAVQNCPLRIGLASGGSLADLELRPMRTASNVECGVRSRLSIGQTEQQVGSRQICWCVTECPHLESL